MDLVGLCWRGLLRASELVARLRDNGLETSVAFANPSERGFYRYTYVSEEGKAGAPTARENNLEPGEWLDDQIVPGSIRCDSFEDVNIMVRNARLFSKIRLASHGFELISHAQNFSSPDFSNDAAHRSWLDESFLPVVAENVWSTLEKAYGPVQAVHIFDATLRTTDNVGITGAQSIVPEAHMDFTPEGGRRRLSNSKVCFRLGDQEPISVEDQPWIVNCWQPLVDTVFRKPLAICDVRSLAPDDLVRKTMYWPDRVGEVYNLKYNPDQKWWYYPHMHMGEALVFVSWTPGGKSVPHSAVLDPTDPPDSPPRRSMEVRCAVTFQNVLP